MCSPCVYVGFVLIIVIAALWNKWNNNNDNNNNNNNNSNKKIFWLRHNLEGKCDNIPYNQSGFYWSKIKFQMIKIDSRHLQSG